MPLNNDIYFFKPDEFRKHFGDDVVTEMEGNPPPLPSAPAERRDREVLLQHVLPRRPFPRPE